LYSVTLLLNLVIAFYYIIDFIDTVLSVYYVEKSRTTSRMPILARGTRRQQKVKSEPGYTIFVFLRPISLRRVTTNASRRISKPFLSCTLFVYSSSGAVVGSSLKLHSLRQVSYATGKI